MKNSVKLIGIACLILAIGFVLTACDADIDIELKDNNDDNSEEVDNNIYSISDYETAQELAVKIYSAVTSVSFDYAPNDADQTPREYTYNAFDSGYVDVNGSKYYTYYTYTDGLGTHRNKTYSYTDITLVFHNYVYMTNLEIVSGTGTYYNDHKYGGFSDLSIVTVDSCKFKFTSNGKKYEGTVSCERKVEQKDGMPPVTSYNTTSLVIDGVRYI